MRRSISIALLLSLGVLWGTLSAAQVQISSEASAHLTEIVSVIQREWFRRAEMDWAAFRQRVFEKAGPAQSIPETYDAIRLALSMLGDRHSYYIAAGGDFIFNPESPTQSTGECIAPDPEPVQVPADIGYVRIQITPQTPKEAIQEALRKGDGPNVSGWIVDLRNSRGGNTWPALAGIGSLLGDGTAGFFIDGDNQATPWGYTNGQSLLGDRAMEELTSPYRVTSRTRVAVLTDIGVASSGEAIAIAFRGRPNTRSFGTATCGLSTGVNQFRLKTGGRVAVVVAAMADRTMTRYGGEVTPDEVISDPSRVIARAVAWLRER